MSDPPLSKAQDEVSAWEVQTAFRRRTEVLVELKLHLPHPGEKDPLPVAYHAVVQIGNAGHQWDCHDVENTVELGNMVEMPEDGTGLSHSQILRALLIGAAGDIERWLKEALGKLT